MNPFSDEISPVIVWEQGESEDGATQFLVSRKAAHAILDGNDDARKWLTQLVIMDEVGADFTGLYSS